MRACVRPCVYVCVRMVLLGFTSGPKINETFVAAKCVVTEVARRMK